MVTKTRDKLIEVARQLFARNGIENTTMNDIATASDKGRRTIYTYFKNKRDIYNAVVERESDQLMATLSQIAASDAPPADKLREFFDSRFDLFANEFHRRDTIRALFGRDFKRLERMHRLMFSRELELLDKILAEGSEKGVFNARAVADMPAVETMLFQGIDFSQFRDNFRDTGMDRKEIKNRIVDFIVNAVSVNNLQ